MGALFARVMLVPRQLVVLVLRLYRAVVSPLYGPTCRFYPSCSEYALVAVERHGVVRGGRLAVWRLLRCNPWNRGGVDAVPPHGGHDTAPPVAPEETSVAGTSTAPSSNRHAA